MKRDFDEYPNLNDHPYSNPNNLSEGQHNVKQICKFVWILFKFLMLKIP